MEASRGRILLMTSDPAIDRWRKLRGAAPEIRVASSLDGTASGSFETAVFAEATDAEFREFARVVRRDCRIGLLPIAVFTGDSRPSIPELYCDCFVPGPFDLTRLEPVLASLAGLSRRVRDLPPLAEFCKSESANHVHALRYLITRQIAWLDPVRDPLSPAGYNYGPMAAMLGCKSGEERQALKRLVQAGKLESRFADRIHLCPFCDVYQLNFRVTCSACGTANIHAHTAIHHYRCAFVGPKEGFQTLNGLVCPKCQRALRHIGVDYEEVGHAYLCASCRMAIADPPVECLCLQCGRTFEPEKAHVEVIESYALTAAGHEMARHAGPVESERKIVGRVSEWKSFVREARLVRAVAKSCGQPCTLVHLKFAGFSEAADRIGLERARGIAGQAIATLAQFLRRTDTVGRLTDSDYFMMLVESPSHGAELLLQRASELAAELLREGLRLNIRKHSFSGSATPETIRVPNKQAA